MYDADAIYLKDSRYDSATCLYKYYDCDGTLLYIGITSNWHRRDEQHRKTADWRWLAASCSMTLFPTRYMAERAEERAIQDEVPPHNAKRPYVTEICKHRVCWYSGFDEAGGVLTGEQPITVECVHPTGHIRNRP